MWTSNPGFWDERIQVFEKVRDARLIMSTPWVSRKKQVYTEDGRS